MKKYFHDDWCTRVAKAVVARAIRDAKGIGVRASIGSGDKNYKDFHSEKIIADAKRFLDRSTELKFWCEVAGLSWQKVYETNRMFL